MENRLTDTYRHKGLRRKLIDELRRKGIRDERVLEAMGRIPRHAFLDSAFADLAYEDQALPIACEQTISQPYTVAFQTEQLDLRKGDKVLEIGTGSGYQAAVLGAMGVRVYTVERQEELFHSARKLLHELGYNNVRCFFRDGTKGLPEHAPYDKIIVTAGADRLPQVLVDQLREGGVMVIPVGQPIQTMKRVTREADGRLMVADLGDFRFVPFVEGTVGSNGKGA